jgi:tRNA-2-methylthio-N6-dimethylallyladenosine synthase
MKRGYSREKYLVLVDAVREHISEACLSTDIICGFPGESESDFADTLELVEKVRYESAFMYYYSPRPGTKAAEMTDQLSEEEKKDRLARLIEVQNRISLEESQKLVGREYEVLVEANAARDQADLVGKTRSGRSVNFPGDNSLTGSYVRVRIEQARNWTLSGRMATEE